MNQAARQLVDAFDALSEREQSEVLAELQRRSASAQHDLPSGDDLVAMADTTFLDLDRREQAHSAHPS